MTKKTLILILGLALCLTNGFADEVPEPILEFRVPEGDAYIQGTEDIKRAPNFIFGEPDYEKMRDLPKNSQDYQLGRKVAYVFTPLEPGVPFGFICTGFLVGPDLLMTNHHCVHDNFGRPFPLELMEIYMDYYQEWEDDPTRGGVTAGVTAVVHADARLDYALLRLDKPIGNTYGWLELDPTTPATPGQSVKLIHHSAGRSKEISRRNSEIVEVPPDLAAYFPFLIAYLADTEGGSSGSPIFLREGTGVIGINHSGWFGPDGPIFNGGSLMSWIVPEIEQYLPKGPAPDLVAEAARVDNAFLRPGESFTLSVTVRNQGTTASPTTLRYYYSTDNTISTDDAPMGTDTVGVLAEGETVEKSITLTAPDYVGTYYYGACVDPAGDEYATYNNCSPAVRIGIRPPEPSGPLSFHPSTIADQEFTVDSPVNLTLPTATGGTPPYTYMLAPMPAGLEFDAEFHSLAGTPTTVGVTDLTYTATDATDASASLTFTIEVIGDDPSPDPGPLDVNGDGQVTAMDLVAVALFYGTQVPVGISLPADVNDDGIVNVLDLTAVAQGIDAAGASNNGLSLEEVGAALLAAVEQAEDVEEIAEAPIGFGTPQHMSSLAYRNVAAALARDQRCASRKRRTGSP